MTRAAVLLACLLVSACGGLVDLGPEGPPPDIYTLEPPPRDSVQQAGAPRLYVEEPHVTGALDSQRIAVRRDGSRIEYLAGARWEERTPRLIQHHVARALDNMAAFEAAGDFNIDLRADYRLRLEIRAFHVALGPGGGPGRVEIEWVALLLRPTSSEIVGSRYFAAGAVPRSDRPADLVAAFNEAMGAIVGELATWVAETTADAASGAAQP